MKEAKILFTPEDEMDFIPIIPLNENEGDNSADIVVEGNCHLPVLSPQFQRQQWGWDWRPARHHSKARLFEGTGGGRHLAFTGLQIAQ